MPGTAVLSDGSPYLCGRPPAHFPYRIHCSACGRKTTISRIDWNALPNVGREELQAVQPIEGHGDFKVLTRGLL